MKKVTLIIVSFVAIAVALAALYMLTSGSRERFANNTPDAYMSNLDNETKEGPSKNTSDSNEKDNGTKGSSSEKKKSVKVLLFYATWCPHCEKYLATGKFDTFDEAVKKDDSIKAQVAFQKIDYDKNQAVGDRYGITAFPTIIAVDDDEKVYRFQGNREKADDMVKFVKGVLEKRTMSSADY